MSTKLSEKGRFVADENAGEMFNVEMTWKAYETPVHKYADRLDDLLGGIMTEEEIEEAQLLLVKMTDAAEDLKEDDDDTWGFANRSGSGNEYDNPEWTQTYTKGTNQSSGQWKTFKW